MKSSLRQIIFITRTPAKYSLPLLPPPHKNKLVKKNPVTFVLSFLVMVSSFLDRLWVENFCNKFTSTLHIFTQQ